MDPTNSYSCPETTKTTRAHSRPKTSEFNPSFLTQTFQAMKYGNKLALDACECATRLRINLHLISANAAEKASLVTPQRHRLIQWVTALQENQETLWTETPVCFTEEEAWRYKLAVDRGGWQEQWVTFRNCCLGSSVGRVRLRLRRSDDVMNPVRCDAPARVLKKLVLGDLDESHRCWSKPHFDHARVPKFLLDSITTCEPFSRGDT